MQSTLNAVKEAKTNKGKTEAKTKQNKSIFAVIETKRGRMPSALAAMSRTNLSLLQQKIFASLIYAVTAGEAEQLSRQSEITKASEDEDVIDDWRIDPKRLKELSRFRSRNHEHFKKSIKELSGRVVELNILGKDDEALLHTTRTLFEGIGFGEKDGKVYFAFSDYVKRKLERFRFYCKFFPSYANVLKHNSSHAIYMLLLDYIDEKRGEGQTPFIEIDKFAKLVGSEGYSDFGVFRENCIKPAINEISENTNIVAYFDRDEDVQYNGRKVTAVRIRGRYKKDGEINNTCISDKSNDKHKRQSSLFDENEITLFDYTISKEGFLNYLSKDATNKSAYKQTMRKALDEGTLGDLKIRVSEYIAFRNEQEKIIEANRQKEKANEFYKRVTDIAIKDKQSKIEELVILTDNGFLSVAGFSKDDLVQLANMFERMSDKQIAKRLFTVKERELYEAKEYDYYQRTIIKPLIDVAPMNSWTMIINGEETKVFYSATLMKAMGNVIALATLRKIERTIKSGVNLTFMSEGRLYSASFNNDKTMVLATANENRKDIPSDMRNDTRSDDETIVITNGNASETLKINNGNAPIALVEGANYSNNNASSKQTQSNEREQ